MSKVEDKLLDHNYDGIQEYDNPLPLWWIYLFIITIIWSFFYIAYYHILGMGDNQHQEYVNEFKMDTKDLVAMANQQQQMWAEIEYVVLENETDISKGAEIFIKNCVSCHGSRGEGGIGPNLTDNYYIHGPGIENTMKVIINGVPEKGMIAWRAVLKPEEVKQVASFILTELKGSEPPNAKAPQGEKYE